MAHHKSTKKRIVLSKKQNARNNSYKSAYKTAVKRVLDSDDKEVVETELRKATSMIDKLVCKKILNSNKAGHSKSQLKKHLNALA